MFLGRICLTHPCSLPVTSPLTEEAWRRRVITSLSAGEEVQQRRLDQAILYKRRLLAER